MITPGSPLSFFRFAIRRPVTGRRKKLPMKHQTHLPTHLVRNSLGRSPSRHGLLVGPLALALGWFALLPGAQATDLGSVVAGNNTADGSGVLVSRTTGISNTGIGFQALNHDTTGSNNTACGFEALLSNTSGTNNTATGLDALQKNTSGGNNTADGVDALFVNSTGVLNTAVGFQALFSNTVGANNTASGANALRSNSTGSNNSASGTNALFSNTTANDNTAMGGNALFSNTTGDINTAVGKDALADNTIGGANTATGDGALSSNTTGNNNTGSGAFALSRNTTGNDNTATGVDTLAFNTIGVENTATGRDALLGNTTGNDNTASGFHALSSNTTGANNIALGSNAGSNLTTGSNNIDIGALGVAGESNKIRIGQSGTQNGAFIAGISGVTVANGVGVIVNSSGKLGTVVSSARFKEAVKPMDKTSEAILALKPVTFRYKEELDPDKIPQFGLVAEEVEKVNPDLVVRGEDGKVMTVRYEAVNAMLLNEFLKEHRKVEEQQATITQMKKQIDSLTAGLQKVSDQMELAKAASQTVATNQ